jgi:hypothetical protein
MYEHLSPLTAQKSSTTSPFVCVSSRFFTLSSLPLSLSLFPFLPLSRVQPRLLPVPAGLCEALPPRLHLRPPAPQPVPGQLGGLVLRPVLPAMPPCLPHLFRPRAQRLPLLSPSQPPGPHRLPAPEPDPAQVPHWPRPPGRCGWTRGKPSGVRARGRGGSGGASRT